MTPLSIKQFGDTILFLIFFSCAGPRAWQAIVQKKSHLIEKRKEGAGICKQEGATDGF
jgi:hypothetical protein